MNVNMKSRAANGAGRGRRDRRRKGIGSCVSTAHLGMALVVVALVYLLWFLFVLFSIDGSGSGSGSNVNVSVSQDGNGNAVGIGSGIGHASLRDQKFHEFTKHGQGQGYVNANAKINTNANSNTNGGTSTSVGQEKESTNAKANVNEHQTSNQLRDPNKKMEVQTPKKSLQVKLPISDSSRDSNTNNDNNNNGDNNNHKWEKNNDGDDVDFDDVEERRSKGNRDRDENLDEQTHDQMREDGGVDTKSNPTRVQLTNYQIKPNDPRHLKLKIKPLTAYIETTSSPYTDSLSKTFQNEIEGSRSRGDHTNKKDDGIPPLYHNPLPLRTTTTPSSLRKFTYPRVDSCTDLQAKLPVDAGLLYELDTDGNPNHRVYPNTNSRRYSFNPFDDAKYCPVDADPYLPWLHDVFPSNDGTLIHFVGQNKRRCNTGNKFGVSLERLEPQVALMQPVGVKVLNAIGNSHGDSNGNGEALYEEMDEAQLGADGLWSPNNRKNNDNANANANNETPQFLEEETYVEGMPRYRLATSSEDADPEGKYTRFICRFHTVEYDISSDGTATTTDIILGETLSTYPFNYEYVNLRKRKPTMLSTKGKDNGLFWLSNLRFDCPVPPNGNLRQVIADGMSVSSDGMPSVYVDVVPIRTNPRWGMEEGYFDLDLVNEDYFENSGGRSPFSPHKANKATDANGNADGNVRFGFDAKTVYGENHVLPRVEASGRWANIPICKAPQRPPSVDELKEHEDAPKIDLKKNGVEDTQRRVEVTKVEVNKKDGNASDGNGSDGNGEPDGDRDSADKPKKPFELIACVWASATFETRGGDRRVDDTMERTREWIEYNLMMGFDHIYIYDNTHANTNHSDLVETLSPFSKAEVTRIEWPSIVCNNNLPAHENTGERSSQYAAESSCRQRYGQYTEWLAAFDTDEYFVPMGKFNTIKEVVKSAAEEGTNVLSFRSTRAYPNYNHMETFGGGGECGKDEDPKCLKKRDNATFLETYNCDFHPIPKPSWSDRAKKQIYRPDYVKSHFVHYSTVTGGILETHKDQKENWNYWYRESKKSERFTDEENEAVMIHSKTTVPGNTKGYSRICMLGFKGRWTEKCRVGFPIPGNKKVVNATTPEGYERNCYTVDRVTNEFVPKLRKAMADRTPGRFDEHDLSR